VAQACGAGRPIPPELADNLLSIAPAMIADADRKQLFASAVFLPSGYRPSDRLAAFMGRDPSTTMATG
jgi:hypothetical protein